jgi:uncharacterized protein YkwD
MPLATPVDVPAYAAANRAERAIVRLLNAERARYGLPGLSISNRLAQSAKRHSMDCLRYDSLAHTSAMSSVTGARSSGETIAWSQRGSGSGARSIVDMWMRSSGHRAIVLNGKFRRIGVGRVRGKLGSMSGVLVTADFASAH